MKKSGRPDLNRGPPAPKAGALPTCATPRLLDMHFGPLHFVFSHGVPVGARSQSLARLTSRRIRARTKRPQLLWRAARKIALSELPGPDQHSRRTTRRVAPPIESEDRRRGRLEPRREPDRGHDARDIRRAASPSSRRATSPTGSRKDSRSRYSLTSATSAWRRATPSSRRERGSTMPSSILT